MMPSEGHETSRRTKKPKLVSPTGDESPLLPVLPEELILEILFRVPVRSLILFRCVCKSWKALISDPQFAKDHLRTYSVTHQQLVYSPCFPREIKFYSVQSMFQNPSQTQTSRCYPMNGNFHILGSCNGILCLYDIYKHYVTLWNPSIRRASLKTLPMDLFGLKSKPDISLSSITGIITYHGFGYDHVNDKYKLLLVEDVESLHQTVTKIYTFGQNGANLWKKIENWKVIENFPCHPTTWQAKFVSGTLNWIAASDDDKWVILSLDLATLAYAQLLLPHGDSGHKIRDPVLGVSRNCLCVSFFDSNEAHFVVWLMKEYGVQRSWTKLMIIPPIIRGAFSLINRMEHLFDPLCIADNGVVMLKTCKLPLVALYNSNDGTLGPSALWGYDWFDMQIYHESLVSPPR